MIANNNGKTLIERLRGYSRKRSLQILLPLALLGLPACQEKREANAPLEDISLPISQEIVSYGNNAIIEDPVIQNARKLNSEEKEKKRQLDLEWDRQLIKMHYKEYKQLEKEVYKRFSLCISGKEFKKSDIMEIKDCINRAKHEYWFMTNFLDRYKQTLEPDSTNKGLVGDLTGKGIASDLIGETDSEFTEAKEMKYSIELTNLENLLASKKTFSRYMFEKHGVTVREKN